MHFNSEDERDGETQMLTWGSKFRRLREMTPLSQYGVSLRSGIGRDKVSRFELGYTRPTAEEREKLEGVINDAITEQLTLLDELRSGTDCKCRSEREHKALNRKR